MHTCEEDTYGAKAVPLKFLMAPLRTFSAYHANEDFEALDVLRDPLLPVLTLR